MMGLIPSLTTEPVPDLPLKIKPPEHIIELTRLYSDIIALVVLGQEQPILLKGGEKTILGRYSPGETTPSVDLTPYNANLLGVSRKHAAISRATTGYLLEDLASTNGTWLNEKKLLANTPIPVQSGDLIRLGQLGLYVYFDIGQSDKNSEIEMSLRKENLESRSLTIQDLSTQLTPYLT
ncbi:MAG: FHA domain-containing protein, partial [Anaerolineae bacterium]|nr:FHA domain-containing protein [Anaerolineae bacterium]